MGHEAKRNRNAKMIVVDPRFTRTAAVADSLPAARRRRYRLLGGIINYAIENTHCTGLSRPLHECGTIVKDGFKLPEADGVFPTMPGPELAEIELELCGGDGKGKAVADPRGRKT
jgi:formate dehydrogenase major subunit